MCKALLSVPSYIAKWKIINKATFAEKKYLLKNDQEQNLPDLVVPISIPEQI